MAIHTLARAWRKVFPSAWPAGFLCRQALADRWLRIHSLTGSRRYPDAPNDYLELLERHNTVATHVLGSGAPCVLFIARYGHSTHWVPSLTPCLHAAKPSHVFTTMQAEEPIQFFGLPVVWRAQAFDELIAAAADDQTGPLLFANLKTACLYAPYDGGADLFFASPAGVALARNQFAPWLSARQDGL
jgi:hypothetical protein